MNVQPVDKSALQRRRDYLLNEKVAHKLGWKRNEHGLWIRPGQTIAESYSTLADYCHSLEAAWEIVEYLKTTPYCTFQLNGNSKVGIYGFWIGTINQRLYFHEANSPARAICLAFLKLP